MDGGQNGAHFFPGHQESEKVRTRKMGLDDGNPFAGDHRGDEFQALAQGEYKGQRVFDGSPFELEIVDFDIGLDLGAEGIRSPGDDEVGIVTRGGQGVGGFDSQMLRPTHGHGLDELGDAQAGSLFTVGFHEPLISVLLVRSNQNNRICSEHTASTSVIG